MMIMLLKYLTNSFLVVMTIGISNVYCQVIQFNLATSESLVLEAVSDTELDFNVAGSGDGTYFVTGQTGPFIINGNNFSEEVVIFRVVAPEYIDITVEVSKLSELTLVCEGDVCPNPLPTLNYQLGWSYWNEGHNPTDPDLAVHDILAGSTEILTPTGAQMPFSTATFPIVERSIGSGPPIPPTPDSGGYTSAPNTVAYLLIYGGITNIPSNNQAGTYEGTIVVSVSIGGV